MTPRRFDRYMVSIGMGTHPKLARLTDSEFRAHIVGVLAIAALAPVRGRLLIGTLPAEPVDVAAAAGVPERVAASAMTKLQAVGVLEPDEQHGCLRVHDWDDCNPSPGAQRTQRWRDGQRDVETSPETSQNRHGDRHAPVTSTSPEVKKLEVEALATPENTSSSDATGADEKSTEEDRQNCALLRQLAADRNPKFKVKSRSRWLNDMRLLRERDGNSVAEIERAIRWVFADDFWGGVIQSPGNLREHFPRIWDRMTTGNAGGQVVPLHKESPSDLIRAINSGGAA